MTSVRPGPEWETGPQGAAPEKRALAATLKSIMERKIF